MTNQSVQHVMETLRLTAHNIIRWADENIAHMGRVNTTSPTFNDLGSAINLLGKMLTKYNLVITGGYMPSVTPVIQEDWKRPFRSV
jgi:hypothetical protein